MQSSSMKSLKVDRTSPRGPRRCVPLAVSPDRRVPACSMAVSCIVRAPQIERAAPLMGRLACTKR